MSKSTWRKALFIFIGTSFILFQNFTWIPTTPQYVVNAVYYTSMSPGYVPLYHGQANVQSSAGYEFVLSNGQVSGYNNSGVALWPPFALAGNSSSSQQRLVTGFDYNGDGVPDFAVIQAGNTVGTCQDKVDGLVYRYQRQLKVYSGYDPRTPVLETSAFYDDDCIQLNGGPLYSLIRRLDFKTIHFGANSGAFALAPQYNETQDFFYLRGVGAPAFYPPESPAFSNYPAAQLNSQNGLTKYFANSQPLNGMFVSPEVNGSNITYVALSSGRVLQYAPWNAVAGVAPLLKDATFPVGRKLPVGTQTIGDPLVGRTYGLFAQDPLNKHYVYLIGGASVSTTLYTDSLYSTMGRNDPEAGLERRLIQYDIYNQTIVNQKLLSYSLDNGGDNAYYKRIVYPANPFLPGRDANGNPASALVYNLYRYGDQDILDRGRDGQWELHITYPGTLTDQTVLVDKVAWDVVTLDNTTSDLLLSEIDTSRPSSFPHDVYNSYNIVGSRHMYYPRFETRVWQKSMDFASMSEVKVIPNLIPFLGTPTSNRATAADSSGVIYPSIRFWDLATHSSLKISMVNSSRIAGDYPYDWYNVPPPPPKYWQAPTRQAWACQYPSQIPEGTMLNGPCNTSVNNVYYTATGEVGLCGSGTYLRFKYTQTCQ